MAKQLLSESLTNNLDIGIITTDELLWFKEN